ncbi:hypothetical protein AXF42_Ash002381 [Apostasia shenzhenica]|uniref:Uncharacterized protein n=1 Tax=Apostasia shenzhenica TaxID=1088818 RepID=A0A2I0AND5_9ASPA|nr:hypothetical protein AXF42_Ash002381 [Apostasia shenzhenica]
MLQNMIHAEEEEMKESECYHTSREAGRGANRSGKKSADGSKTDVISILA